MRRIGILALLLAASCESEPTATGQLFPVTPAAEMRIGLRVSGDDSMIRVGGDAFYSIRVDSSSGSISPNQVRSILVSPGTHTITLTRFVGGFEFGGILLPSNYLPWCDPVPPLSISKSVAAGDTIEILFEINCPSRDGNGIVRLTLGATGEQVPDSAQVYLLSQLPGRKLTPVIVATRAVTDISIAAGAYTVGIDVPSCPFVTGPYSGTGGPFVLHVGAVKAISATLPCK